MFARDIEIAIADDDHSELIPKSADCPIGINLLTWQDYGCAMASTQGPRPQIPESSLIDIVGMPVIVMLISVVAVLGLITEPSAHGPVAAVFPPWWSASQAFQAAGSTGPVIRFGGYPFVVIALPRRRRALIDAGAWFLLNPEVLKACG